ncbi:rRNA biogenesis protein rrp36 [Penicillium oxalicum]|uniref:rRNA biogenesis protein rrp36 n=1 Tax=Penicillium oxalicum TaxID=69781 RepID=UPI0020B6D550|nr:rRNA biogenesis protein rrp36 [Penicillium oxalicum]KAI2791805.1 rRNA biogenesis protein rrp36 [Penicillium oxalicum]
MAISDILNRRVRARPDEDDEIYSEQSSGGEGVSQDEDEHIDDSNREDLDSDNSQDESDNAASDSDSDSEANEHEHERESDNSSDSESDPNEDIKESLSNISFGALAKAQASMGPKKRKNKPSTSAPESEPTSTASPLDDIRAKIRAAREQKREAAAKALDTTSTSTGDGARQKKAARSSKHAPMVQSSKYAVSRKRVIVEPSSAPKARDPRFDAAVMGHSGKGNNTQASEKAYSFLDEYRASELRDLKRQMAQTKNPEAKEALKRQIRSATDQQKARENKKREEAVIAEHKKKEKEAIRDGKKSTPYFLKKSDLKKQVMQKKYEEMGSRDRAKALERRRKKLASKERKEMPMERRGFEGMDGGPPARGGGGGGKRRRLE